MNPSPSVRLVRLSCLGSALTLAIAVRAASPAASVQSTVRTEGATVELPTFTVTVTDSAVLPEPEAWRYTRIGDFDVISNAADRNTRRLLADFHTFLRTVRLIWPVPAKPLAGTSLILSGRLGKFDAFLPAGPRPDGLAPVSLLVRDREQAAIVVDFESRRIDVQDAATMAATGGGSVEYEVDHYQQLYREYVHFLLSQVEARPPAWLEEGLTQIVMDIELTDTALIYGRINTDKGAGAATQFGETDANDPTADTGAIVGEQPFNAVLRNRRLIPLDQFFAVTHDSPEARSPLGNTRWAKQAYAFVHFCLFGENLRHKEGLVRLVQKLPREPMSEALFRDAFGLGYADMQKQLAGYIRHVKHKYQRYEIAPGDRFTAKSIELRDATQPEIGLILGDALRLAGKADAAHAAYRTAYLRGGRQPALLAALGQAEIAAGRDDRGRRLLDAAVQDGVNRPSAYVAQARLRLAEIRRDAGESHRLDREQVAAVLHPLLRARQHPPLLPDTYRLIAEVWHASASPPTPEQVAELDEGVRQFPRDSELVLAAARLNQTAGLTDRAVAIAQLGLRFAGNDATRGRFQALLGTLPAATPAAK